MSISSHTSQLQYNFYRVAWNTARHNETKEKKKTKKLLLRHTGVCVCVCLSMRVYATKIKTKNEKLKYLFVRLFSQACVSVCFFLRNDFSSFSHHQCVNMTLPASAKLSKFSVHPCISLNHFVFFFFLVVPLLFFAVNTERL